MSSSRYSFSVLFSSLSFLLSLLLILGNNTNGILGEKTCDGNQIYVGVKKKITSDCVIIRGHLEIYGVTGLLEVQMPRLERVLGWIRIENNSDLESIYFPKLKRVDQMAERSIRIINNGLGYMITTTTPAPMYISTTSSTTSLTYNMTKNFTTGPNTRLLRNSNTNNENNATNNSNIIRLLRKNVKNVLLRKNNENLINGKPNHDQQNGVDRSIELEAKSRNIESKKLHDDYYYRANLRNYTIMEDSFTLNDKEKRELQFTTVDNPWGQYTPKTIFLHGNLVKNSINFPVLAETKGNVYIQNNAKITSIIIGHDLPGNTAPVISFTTTTSTTTNNKISEDTSVTTTTSTTTTTTRYSITSTSTTTTTMAGTFIGRRQATGNSLTILDNSDLGFVNVGGYFQGGSIIENNIRLTNLGMNINYCAESFTVKNNNLLNIFTFNRFQYTGALHVNNNGQETNFKGGFQFPALHTIRGKIEIKQNKNLRRIDMPILRETGPNFWPSYMKTRTTGGSRSLGTRNLGTRSLEGSSGRTDTTGSKRTSAGTVYLGQRRRNLREKQRQIRLLKMHNRRVQEKLEEFQPIQDRLEKLKRRLRIMMKRVERIEMEKMERNQDVNGRFVYSSDGKQLFLIRNNDVRQEFDFYPSSVFLDLAAMILEIEDFEGRFAKEVEHFEANPRIYSDGLHRFLDFNHKFKPDLFDPFVEEQEIERLEDLTCTTIKEIERRYKKEDGVRITPKWVRFLRKLLPEDWVSGIEGAVEGEPFTSEKSEPFASRNSVSNTQLYQQARLYKDQKAWREQILLNSRETNHDYSSEEEISTTIGDYVRESRDSLNSIPPVPNFLDDEETGKRDDTRRDLERKRRMLQEEDDERVRDFVDKSLRKLHQKNSPKTNKNHDKRLEESFQALRNSYKIDPIESRKRLRYLDSTQPPSFAIDDNTRLEEIIFGGEIAGILRIIYNPDLRTIASPKFEKARSLMIIADNPRLERIAFSSLREIGTGFKSRTGLNVDNNINMAAASAFSSNNEDDGTVVIPSGSSQMSLTIEKNGISAKDRTGTIEFNTLFELKNGFTIRNNVNFELVNFPSIRLCGATGIGIAVEIKSNSLLKKIDIGGTLSGSLVITTNNDLEYLRIVSLKRLIQNSSIYITDNLMLHSILFDSLIEVSSIFFASNGENAIITGTYMIPLLKTIYGKLVIHQNKNIHYIEFGILEEIGEQAGISLSLKQNVNFRCWNIDFPNLTRVKGKIIVRDNFMLKIYRMRQMGMVCNEFLKLEKGSYCPNSIIDCGIEQKYPTQLGVDIGIPRLTVNCPLDVSLSDSTSAGSLMDFDALKTDFIRIYGKAIDVDPIKLTILGFKISNPVLLLPSTNDGSIEVVDTTTVDTTTTTTGATNSTTSSTFSLRILSDNTSFRKTDAHISTTLSSTTLSSTTLSSTSEHLNRNLLVAKFLDVQLDIVQESSIELQKTNALISRMDEQALIALTAALKTGLIGYSLTMLIITANKLNVTKADGLYGIASGSDSENFQIPGNSNLLLTTGDGSLNTFGGSSGGSGSSISSNTGEVLYGNYGEGFVDNTDMSSSFVDKNARTVNEGKGGLSGAAVFFIVISVGTSTFWISWKYWEKSAAGRRKRLAMQSLRQNQERKWTPPTTGSSRPNTSAQEDVGKKNYNKYVTEVDPALFGEGETTLFGETTQEVLGFDPAEETTQKYPTEAYYTEEGDNYNENFDKTQSATESQTREWNQKRHAEDVLGRHVDGEKTKSENMKKSIDGQSAESTNVVGSTTTSLYVIIDGKKMKKRMSALEEAAQGPPQKGLRAAPQKHFGSEKIKLAPSVEKAVVRLDKATGKTKVATKAKTHRGPQEDFSGYLWDRVKEVEEEQYQSFEYGTPTISVGKGNIRQVGGNDDAFKNFAKMFTGDRSRKKRKENNQG